MVVNISLDMGDVLFWDTFGACRAEQTVRQLSFPVETVSDKASMYNENDPQRYAAKTNDEPVV